MHDAASSSAAMKHEYKRHRASRLIIQREMHNIGAREIAGDERSAIIALHREASWTIGNPRKVT